MLSKLRIFHKSLVDIVERKRQREAEAMEEQGFGETLYIGSFAKRGPDLEREGWHSAPLSHRNEQTHSVYGVSSFGPTTYPQWVAATLTSKTEMDRTL